MRLSIKAFLISLLIAIAAFLSVWLCYNFVAGFLEGERRLFDYELLHGQPIYPHLYWWHAVLLRFFALAGVMVLAYSLLKYTGRFLPAYQSNKSLYLNFTLGFIFYMSVVVVFAVAEKHLRVKGFVPGQEYRDKEYLFTTVDSLKSFQQHLADGVGMNYENPDYSWTDGLHQVNKEGFYSPFDYTPEVANAFKKEGKKIVFVIGDSFTEGVFDSSFSYVETFAQRLKTMQHDYAVFVFGVGGSDPLNYRLITEKYVPLLKPDVVIIAFCGSNDVMSYDRIATPGIPLYWQTNAGWLLSNVPEELSGTNNLILASAQQAYYYYKKAITLNGQDSGLPRFCSRLCFTTQLYFKFKTLKHFIVKKPDGAHRLNGQADFSYQHLHAIDSICLAQNAAMQIVFIPDDAKVDKVKTPEQFNNAYGFVLKDLSVKTHYPFGYSYKTDYLPGGHHFNAEGNRKFAEFTDSIIRQNLH